MSVSNIMDSRGKIAQQYLPNEISEIPGILERLKIMEESVTVLKRELAITTERLEQEEKRLAVYDEKERLAKAEADAKAEAEAEFKKTFFQKLRSLF